MSRTIAIAVIAALPLLFSAGEVKAQRSSVNGVDCPAGTCNPGGGHRASDVKYCKPSNCKANSVK